MTDEIGLPTELYEYGGGEPDRSAGFEPGDELVKAIIATARQGIVVLDRNLRYQVFNPFMEELSQTPAADVLGKGALDVFPQLQEHGIDELWARALAGETVTSRDIPVRVAATGRTIWVVGSYTPIRSGNGEIQAVLGLIHDITQRKQAESQLQANEQRYRTLLEKLNVGVFQSTLRGDFIHVNQAVAAIGGYSSTAEVMATPAARLYADPADRERVIALLRREGRVEELELRAARKDGTPYWVSMMSP